MGVKIFVPGMKYLNNETFLLISVKPKVKL